MPLTSLLNRLEELSVLPQSFLDWEPRLLAGVAFKVLDCYIITKHSAEQILEQRMSSMLYLSKKGWIIMCNVCVTALQRLKDFSNGNSLRWFLLH